MLTSSQRAKLRGLANDKESIVQVGKDGINENLVHALDEALEARELVKATVLKNCDLPVREVCHVLAAELGADPVQVIGRKFVLYRPSKKNPVIEL